MIFKTNLALNNLHCVTPTDPSGEDDPYLWVFFVKADGSNIWQRPNDPLHLSANITLVSGSGRPGNLNVSGVKGGANIHIPPSLGVSNNNLKPIILAFAQTGTAVRIFVPGRIVALCITIDEESTSREAMEGAFNAVKNLIQTRLNDFINSLDLQSMAATAFANSNPENTFQSLFSQQLAQFISNIQQEAKTLAIHSAAVAVVTDMDDWNPIDVLKSFVELADADEFIGSARFIFSEKDILDNNMERRLHADLRQSRTGLGGAWYILDGYLDAAISFGSVDLKSQNLPEVSQAIGPPEEYTFQRDHLCVFAGDKVQVTKLRHSEKYQTYVEYPFAKYRYTLDGQVLNGNKDTIQLTKDVQIPEFNEDSLTASSPFVEFRHATRQVTIQFEKRHLPHDPQIEQLFLMNDPDDGNYSLSLNIEAVLNNCSAIPVGIEAVFFDGQTIKLPDEFSRHIQDCLENFVGTKWSKSKRVSKKDLWGPAARRVQYEKIAKELDALATAGAFEKHSVEAAKNTIAAALKIKQH